MPAHTEQILPPEQLKPGDTLSRSVIDFSIPGGSVLYEKGTSLDSASIKTLAGSGISNIFIHDRSTPSGMDVEFIGEDAERVLNKATGSLHIDSENSADLHENITRFTSTLLSSVVQNGNFELKNVQNAALELQEHIRANEPAMISLAHLRDVDQYTFMHSVNVSIFGLLLAEKAGLSQEQQTLLGTGSILHDIGKMAVDQTVLNKPGRLSTEEFLEIKNHARKGYLILKDRGIDEATSQIALTHHEKLNGKGYPFGLTEQKLPTLSRIAAIVDIYDALTADRVYKKALHPAQAFEILEEESGTGLDAHLLTLFQQILGKYPVSCEVLLVNGSVARVLEQNKEDLSRPIIEIIRNRFGNRPEKRSIINTLTSGKAEYSIKGIHKTG